MFKFENRKKFETVDWEHDQWDAYVLQHPKGTIFHTQAMIRAFACSRDFQPLSLAAIDQSGKVVALLSSFRVMTLRRLPAFASRAIQYAEPLCDSSTEGVEALKQLIGLHDQRIGAQSLLSEVRSIAEPGVERDVLRACNYTYADYINYLVDLQKPVEELWSQLNKRLRQRIRATFRAKLEIRDDNSRDGVDRLYKVLQYSFSRAKVPLVSRDLFEPTLEHLPAESVRIRTAFQQGEPVASIFSLLFGDRVFSWYGGTLRLNGRSPFACIVWDDIEWGCRNGYKIYDFGGAGWPHEEYGPRKFKAGFGGQQVRYGRYLLPHSRIRYRIAELAYGVSRKMGAWSTH